MPRKLTGPANFSVLMVEMTIPDDTGVILVDHGSKFATANAMLLDVVAVFRQRTGARIVEPAHMELAEPTVAQAFARCVEQGARTVVVQPYFLAPGRHSTEDIPRLAREAAADYPEVSYVVTEPLGVDARIADLILDRVRAVTAENQTDATPSRKGL